MASQITDTDIISNPVDVVLQARFLARAQQVCIYFAGTQPGMLDLHRGSRTAKWRRYEQLNPSTSSLAQLDGNLSFPLRDAVVPSITDITATVLRYGQHFVINEEVDLTNPTGQDMELTDVIAEAGGRSMNRLMRDEMEDNSTKIRAGGVGADASIVSALSLNDVRNVFNTLQRNSARVFTPETTGSTNYNTAPIRPAYWGFCHVDVEQDVRSMAGFIDAVAYSGQTRTAPNEFGTVGGVRFISTEEASIETDAGGNPTTNNIRSTTGVSADLYQTIVMGQYAVGSLGWGMESIREVYRAGDRVPALQLITVPRAPSLVDPYGEIAAIGYKFWIVNKILNTNWVRRLTSGASNLT